MSIALGVFRQISHICYICPVFMSYWKYNVVLFDCQLVCFYKSFYLFCRVSPKAFFCETFFMQYVNFSPLSLHSYTRFLWRYFCGILHLFYQRTDIVDIPSRTTPRLVSLFSCFYKILPFYSILLSWNHLLFRPQTMFFQHNLASFFIKSNSIKLQIVPTIIFQILFMSTIPDLFHCFFACLI